MLTFKNLLGDNTVADIPIAHQQNLDMLLKKVRVLELAYGKNFVVTSGYRSEQKHLEIYSRKGIHPPKVPMRSQHLSGNAVDIADSTGAIKAWLLQNLNLLDLYDLYIEHPDATPTWLHIQQLPPKSKNRIFKP